jgi:ketosteroid isomerase-like protein
MKSLFLFALLSATLLLPAQTVSDEADMHNFARRFMAAYNAGDHTALGKMYTADAVRTDPNGNQIVGADKIAAYFAEQFRKNNATLLLRQQHTSWSESQGTLTTTGTYAVYGKQYVYDIEIDINGTYTNTLVKQKGEWKIARSVLVSTKPGEHAAVIDALYKAFAEGDIPAVRARLDANVVWYEAENYPYADNNPYIGPDAVLNGVFGRIGEEWEYWNLTGIQLHEVAGGKVLSTLRYEAKHKKTGKLIDAQTAHLFTLKGGKVSAFQQFTDTKQVADAVR